MTRGQALTLRRVANGMAVGRSLGHAFGDWRRRTQQRHVRRLKRATRTMRDEAQKASSGAAERLRLKEGELSTALSRLARAGPLGRAHAFWKSRAGRTSTP